MKLEDFKYNDWTSQWAGKWSILTFSYWGNFYCRKPFSKDIDKYVDNTAIISKEGKGWAYQRASVKKDFSTKLAEKIMADENFVKDLTDNLIAGSDKVLAMMEENMGKDMDFSVYKDFQEAIINEYYPYHIENKLVADVLRPEFLEKYLPLLEEARIHSEPVFNMTEKFMQALAKVHEAKINLPAHLILSSVRDEFDAYFKYGKALPEVDVLEKRYKESAYLFDETNMEIVVGEDVSEIEDIIRKVDINKELSGQTAYPGKVIGKVKKVLDVDKVGNDFVEGSILVAGMTRPEYLPLMKKAAAFVTDSGGVLSHAAITARELKKPCVIGTEVATQVLKDGDLVEVDADKGIVRKI